MLLAKMWASHPEEVKRIGIERIVGLAGGLRDGGDGSLDYRSYLSEIPSNLLSQYAGECLSDTFRESGLALQDIINEVGRRLDFIVTDGRYQGMIGRNNADGLWRANDGSAIVVEVKTTNAYAIDLSKIAKYRDLFIESGAADPYSSILIVVGRNDTDGLESQVRGSNYANNTRLISVNALLRLLHIKESTESPEIGRQIRSILTPHDFIRLDSIVDLVFSTAEDIRQEDISQSLIEHEEDAPPINSSVPVRERIEAPPGVPVSAHSLARYAAPAVEQRTYAASKHSSPVAFHDACIGRIQRHLSRSMVKRSRVYYTSADGSTGVICMLSKEHEQSGASRYWYGFRRTFIPLLRANASPYVAFGCGSADKVLLIPFSEFEPHLTSMSTAGEGQTFFWHVHLTEQHGRFMLQLKRGLGDINYSKFVLPR